MRALVTGGAGNIGGAITTRLAAHGYAVTVADLAEPTPGVAKVAERHLAVDVATETGAREAVLAAADTDGLDVLVNCLGISPKKSGARKPLTDIDLVEWEQVFAVNVTSCFLAIREAMTVLRPNGSVVNVVSAVAKLGTAGPEGTTYGPAHPAAAHYCASKAALSNLTVSAARELAVRGVRCNGVAPGYIGSGMGGSTHPAVEKALIRELPLGRPGSPAEVASVVAFLVGSEASYITGEIVDVDGGWVAD